MSALFSAWEWVQLLYIPTALLAASLLSAAIVEWKLRRPRGSVVPRLSQADRAIEAAPAEQDGLSLHLRVPMERWCVTQDDLKQFRRLVKNAVIERRIVPTQQDQFDLDDDDIGPCVHTVNAQFIMPVTRAAGGQSWALMKHPEGLPCHLFVTHGWAEGIYEFIDKVLGSWPRSSWQRPVRNAYCCMLSNPQNLDISELCRTPEESPFFKALARASSMLVVPNAKSSIYTRVWCAYEAFLGYSWGKQITTAVPVGRNYWLRSLQAGFLILAGYGGGFVLSVGLGAAGWGGARTMRTVSQVAFCPFALLYLARRSSQGSVALAVARCAALSWGGIFIACESWLLPLERPGMEVAALVVLGICAVAAAFAVEMDIIVAGQAVVQTKELLNGFTGHLRDAECSVAADGERIRRALAESGSEEEVDGAVEVLISMGTFSPGLRKAVDKAGILNNVARCNYPMIVICLFWWAYTPLEQFIKQRCEKFVLAWFSWALMMCWVLVAAFLPHDRIAFAVCALLLFVPGGSAYWWDHAVGGGSCISDWVLVCMSPIIVLLSVLGPAGTARVPLVGPLVVRLLLNCSHRRQTIKTREGADSATETQEVSDATETQTI